MTDNTLSDFRRTNRWTSSQREFLLFSLRAYVIDWDNLAKIFNTVFAQDLARRGFAQNQALPVRSLQAQWSEMRSLRTPIYRRIYEETAYSDLLNTFADYNEKFLRTAKSRNITVLLSNEDDVEQKEMVEQMLRDIILGTQSTNLGMEVAEVQGDELHQYEVVTDDSECSSGYVTTLEHTPEQGSRLPSLTTTPAAQTVQRTARLSLTSTPTVQHGRTHKDPGIFAHGKRCFSVLSPLANTGYRSCPSFTISRLR